MQSQFRCLGSHNLSVTGTACVFVFAAYTTQGLTVLHGTGLVGFRLFVTLAEGMIFDLQGTG